MAHWRDGGIGNMMGSDDRPFEEWTLLERLSWLTEETRSPQITEIAQQAFDEISRKRENSTNGRPRFVSLTRSTGADTAARWMQRYAAGGEEWRERFLSGGMTAGEVYNKLLDLGDAPSREAVAAIIGNKSWSYVRCDSCSDEVEETVRIGESHDINARNYCRLCISEAMELFGAKHEA